MSWTHPPSPPSLKFYMKNVFLSVVALAVSSPPLFATNVSLDGEGYIYLEQPVGWTQTPVPDDSAIPLGTKRFLWDPGHGALRFGQTDTNSLFYSWSALNLGPFSFAAGLNTSAAGAHSFAFGKGAHAHDTHSFAFGENVGASRQFTIVFGKNSFADGNYSVAIGAEAQIKENAHYSYALGKGTYIEEDSEYSYAIGRNTEVEAWGAFAVGDAARTFGYRAMSFGADSYSQGDRSISLGGFASGTKSLAGSGATTWGDYSTAFGLYAATTGDHSFAMGNSLTVYSPFSLAIGRFNTNQTKSGLLPPNRVADINADDPVFEIGIGTSSSDRRNALTVYRDGSSRFEGPVQLKAGSGYLTLQPSGTTNRTLTLPDMDGTMLTSNSTLDPAKLGGGTVAENVLPVSVTKLGATIELNSAETTGNLPWTRISGKPATLAGYLPSTAVDAEGRIAVAIRILPQGDIPMFGATP